MISLALPHTLVLKAAHLLMYMCLPTNFPITMPAPDKSTKTVVQAYLQYIYATFIGSLTLITDNGIEF